MNTPKKKYQDRQSLVRADLSQSNIFFFVSQTKSLSSLKTIHNHYVLTFKMKDTTFWWNTDRLIHINWEEH